MKRVVVLGSTGAAGRQVLTVLQALSDRCRVVGLAGNTNHSVLAEQVNATHPDHVWYAEGAALPSASPLAGRPRLEPEAMAALPGVDLVVDATAGMLAGLPGTLAALRAGKRVAVANLELLAAAGALLAQTADQHGAAIFPLDSTLSAVAQCLRGEPSAVRRVVLPVTLPAPATAPTTKRAADAATLMHAGLQAMAAVALFGVPAAAIEVVEHGQGVTRAMVEFCDGSVKTVFGAPDLAWALQYALSFPERWGSPALSPLDLARVGTLTFTPIDPAAYPCLRLALDAAAAGGTLPAVLNAANEVAVAAVLSGRATLAGIPALLAAVAGQHRPVRNPTIDDLCAADAWARLVTLQASVA